MAPCIEQKFIVISSIKLESSDHWCRRRITTFSIKCWLALHRKRGPDWVWKATRCTICATLITGMSAATKRKTLADSQRGKRVLVYYFVIIIISIHSITISLGRCRCFGYPVLGCRACSSRRTTTGKFTISRGQWNMWNSRSRTESRSRSFRRYTRLTPSRTDHENTQRSGTID